MINAASGTPQYSGNFIPELWSGKLLEKFYSAVVLAHISNTDYEGEFSNKGDIVHIRTVPDMIIRNYDENASLKIQRPTSPMVDFRIDYAKYFNFLCDDVAEYQSDIPLMETWSDDAGEQMAIHIDTAILADIYADAHADNKGAAAGKKSEDINMGASGAPLVVTSVNIPDIIIDSGTILGEQDVPEKDKWMVLPKWAVGKIKKSDLKDASLTGDGTSSLRSGLIGSVDTFNIHSSNLLTSVTDGSGVTAWHALMGQKKALSFAAQMKKMESLRSEVAFGRLIRGLNVYGYKVLKPEALVDCYICKG